MVWVLWCCLALFSSGGAGVSTLWIRPHTLALWWCREPRAATQTLSISLLNPSIPAVPCNYLRERKIRARNTLQLAPPLHGPLLILQQLSPDGHVCKALWVFIFLFFVPPLLYFCLRTIHGECDVDISIPDDCDYAIDSKSLLREGVGSLAYCGQAECVCSCFTVETLCSLVCCVFFLISAVCFLASLVNGWLLLTFVKSFWDKIKTEAHQFLCTDSAKLLQVRASGLWV